MLLFGFECDVKNVSLSQIFLTEPMLVVVTVVFGQIVRVICLVLRVSWCESQNASLQALFVCVLDGGNIGLPKRKKVVLKKVTGLLYHGGGSLTKIVQLSKN